MKKRRKATPPQRTSVRRLEWIAALFLTALIVILHFVNWAHAGGLWRDEAAAVNLALFPSLSEIWAHIEHESFPLLLTLLLRGWNAIGLGGSDLALRVFGLLIGLAILAALWWNAWQFAASPPLISLLLFGLSGTLIRWGDSLRAYGLGVLLLLLALGLIWKVVRSPSRRTLIFGMLVSLLAVQTLYQSAFVLAAFCLGGVVVALRRRDFKRALLVISTGTPAALSLIPYLGVMKRASQWNVVTEVPLDWSRIWLVLHRALSDPSPLMFWLWAILLPAAIVVGCLLLRTNGKPSPADDGKELAPFLLTILVALTLAYYLFLTALKFPTEAWYYLVWMAVAAVAIDALIARWVRDDRSRMLRVIAVVILAALFSPGAWKRACVRMTNLDLAAQRLNQESAKEDLILIHPWFCGVTFKRYYTGGAECLTLPPLSDHRLQRLDLFKEQMQLEAPIQPVLEKVEATLRSGHTVWLVGHYPFSQPPRPPPKMPRAGEGPSGWNEAPYMTAYGMEVAYFLQAHAGGSTPVNIEVGQAVNPFENFPVRAVTGWEPARF
jgi:hypothetical protein